VSALERYAAEVRDADTAYAEWQRRNRLADLDEQRLDLIAGTALASTGSSRLRHSPSTRPPPAWPSRNCSAGNSPWYHKDEVAGIGGTRVGSGSSRMLGSRRS